MPGIPGMGSMPGMGGNPFGGMGGGSDMDMLRAMEQQMKGNKRF